MSDLEVRTEPDEAIALFPGAYAGVCLRVMYRQPGVRRWTRFLLVPDEGEGLVELEAKAVTAARLHAERSLPVSAAATKERA